MTHLAADRRVALAGGGESMRALTTAARDLKEGRRTWHPELLIFPSWGELQDYADHDPAGGDLKPFVDLIDQHGPEAVLAAVDQLAPEADADVTISTAHRAKGREWPTVRIADDFTPPKDTDQQDENGPPSRGRLMTAKRASRMSPSEVVSDAGMPNGSTSGDFQTMSLIISRPDLCAD